MKGRGTNVSCLCQAFNKESNKTASELAYTKDKSNLFRPVGCQHGVFGLKPGVILVVVVLLSTMLAASCSTSAAMTLLTSTKPIKSVWRQFNSETS